VDDSDLKILDGRLAALRAQAEAYADSINKTLPSKACPECNDDGHLAGFRCPVCGYCHPQCWLTIRATEWGYSVVALNAQRKPLKTFNLPEGA